MSCLQWPVTPIVIFSRSYFTTYCNIYLKQITSIALSFRGFHTTCVPTVYE
jgi:hypothetical protein